MNGLTAKRLRRLALRLLAAEKISAGEGFRKYKQLLNKLRWEPAYTDNHLHSDNDVLNMGQERLKDPDGNPLLGRVKRPGTIVIEWKFRIVYKNLKRLWKGTGGKHPLFREIQ